MREVTLGSSRHTPPFRLPDTVRPTHYDIEVEPDLAGNTFKGRVIVDLDVHRPTSYLVFHALRLNITHVSVTSTTREYGVGNVQYNPESETAYVKLDKSLPAGSSAVFEVKYVGEMNAPGSMAGLYPTPYQTPSGHVKPGFETMMQPTMARAVFPCWDEPNFKAQFTVTIVTSAELTCLSNMEIKSEEPAPSRLGEPMKKVVFNTSPRMSTYLVVMVGGYFNCVESTEFRVPVRVWVPLDKDIRGASYALDMAISALRVHESNFGLEYPLPKLDMVAIPGHQGGMEHWGCVTYSDRSLILSDRPSEAERLTLAYFVAHELAHQWFGNIVTTTSWDSLWLNEGFSDWAAVHALTEMLPEWDAWTNFLAGSTDRGFGGDYQTALDLDANSHSHAILDPNIPPSAAFDSIAYRKGCCIIRMLAEDLGTSVFLAGIRRYLNKYLYGNATTDDLWDVLSEVSGKDVAKTMSVWTQIVGYPLLTVNHLRPTGQLVVTQSRFLQNGEDDAQSGPYPILIHINSSEGVQRHEMTESKTTLSANLFYYKLNFGQTGFYRVSYPLSRIHKFAVQFSSNSYSTKDKVGIVSDLGALVETGAPDRRLRLSEFLDFLFSIKDHVEDLFLWREMLAQLGKIRTAFLFEGDQILEILKLVRLSLLHHAFEKGHLEFTPGDTMKQIVMKSLLFSELSDHPVVQGKAKEAWNRLLGGDTDAINPNIRQPIFKSVVSSDTTDVGVRSQGKSMQELTAYTQKTWLELKSIAFEKLYISPTDPITPSDAFRSLGSTREPDLIAKTLELITPSTSAQSSWKALTTLSAAPFTVDWAARDSVLNTLSEHPGGAEATWRWVVNNWDILKNGRGKGSINNLGFLEYALRGLSTTKHLQEVEAFFADKINESNRLVLGQVMDRIRTRAQFVNADREDLLEWARANGMEQR